MNAELFLGQFDYRDDQKDHHQYSNHRPNPHASAHPAIHPAVCMVHHVCIIHQETPFVTLSHRATRKSREWRQQCHLKPPPKMPCGVVRRGASWRLAIFTFCSDALYGHLPICCPFLSFSSSSGTVPWIPCPSAYAPSCATSSLPASLPFAYACQSAAPPCW